MKKSVALILSLLILLLLAAILVFTNSKNTTPAEPAIESDTEVAEEKADDTTETPQASNSEENVLERIANLRISGTDFESLTINLSKEQNGIITTYDLTTDTLDHVSVNNSSFDNLVNTLPEFTSHDLIAENVTNLGLYGLDNPVLHLVIDFYDANTAIEDISEAPITNTLDFIWGNTLEDGRIIFMKSNEKNVYAMDASFLASLKEIATPFNLSSKFIALTNISEVQSIDIAFPDTTYHVEVNDADSIYSLNNISIEKDAFKGLYRSIIGIYGETLLQVDEISSDSTPQITITYNLLDGSTKVATFTPALNDAYYQSTLNETMIVWCGKAQFDALRTALDSFLSDSL